jgi:FHA domain
MSSQARFAPPEQTIAQPEIEETAQLEAPDVEPILDALGLLDHRTRTRAISTRLAPYGHYLAFAEGRSDWLVPLESNVTHVGRGHSSDVRIDEQRVSRTHAILVRHGQYVRLLDNRSANGTFLNGRRIVATNISDGDVIRLGPVVMTYVKIG